LVSALDSDKDFKVVEALALSYDWFLVARAFAPEIVKSEEIPNNAIIYKFYLILL
jgi:cyanate lyase